MSWLIDLFKEIPLSSVLKEKLTTADERIKTLEAENAALREKDNNSQVRVRQLEEQVADIEREKNQLQAETYKTTEFPHVDTLTDIKAELLKILAVAGSLPVFHIVEALNYGLHMKGQSPLITAKIEHYLAEMHDDGFVAATRNSINGTEYYLNRRGEKYLEDNDLWPAINTPSSDESF